MKYLAFLLCAVVCFAQSTVTPERAEKLKTVHSIFVDGNNVGAIKIREEIEKGKTCFTLASKASEADAVFAIIADSQTANGIMFSRDYIVSGNLTDKAGELLWSGSERFQDAPFMNGGKTAGKILIGDLRRQVCKKENR